MFDFGLEVFYNKQFQMKPGIGLLLKCEINFKLIVPLKNNINLFKEKTKRNIQIFQKILLCSQK